LSFTDVIIKTSRSMNAGWIAETFSSFVHIVFPSQRKSNMALCDILDEDISNVIRMITLHKPLPCFDVIRTDRDLTHLAFCVLFL
jgi:hypothetical protein